MKADSDKHDELHRRLAALEEAVRIMQAQVGILIDDRREPRRKFEPESERGTSESKGNYIHEYSG